MSDDRDLAQPAAEAVELHPVEPDDSAMALVAALGAAEDARAAIDEAIDTLQTSMSGRSKPTLVESLLALTRVAKRLCGDLSVEIQVAATSKEVEELNIPREGWCIASWGDGVTASLSGTAATLVINTNGEPF